MPGVGVADDPAVGVVELDRPVDLRLTMAPLRHGHHDPTIRFAHDGVWRATRTPQGPGTVHLRAGPDRTVHVRAWGPGGAWLLAHAPDLCGARDSLAGFEPDRHPVVAALVRALPGLRLACTGRVLDALVPAVLEQKVIGLEARRSWAALVRRFGERAPGPVDLRIAPAVDRLAAITSSTWHRLGVERTRADTIARAASVAGRLEEATDAASLRRRLLAIPGIGPWTAAEVTIVAFGDADAVSVGDYHLPHMVAWALAREPRGDDARMLELLAPFPGHRGRVVRLLEAGAGGAPRRGARLPLRELARH